MPAPRYPHLDALRGLAALGVLVFHVAFSSALAPVWLRHVAPWVNTLGHTLAHGVEVFFVLSGWVIAHSMRRDALGFSSLGRFLARRILRLTPPYWAAIVLSLVFAVVARHLGSGDAAPTAFKIALNFVYLQNLVHAGNVFSPAWTLCIEAQFYVVFAGMLGLAGAFGRGQLSDEPFGRARLPLAVLLFGSALATLALALKWNNEALFVSWWFYFAGGALGYLASRDSRFRPFVWAVLAAMALASLWLWKHPLQDSDGWRAIFVGALALGFLMLAHGRERITNWGRAGLFEWLGRVSYSLYLTHFGFGLLLARAFRKVSGWNAPKAVGFLVLDMALCLLLAGAFWKWVEQPSIKWAQRFKLKSDAVREPARTSS